MTLVKVYGVIFPFLPSIWSVNKYQGFYDIFSIEEKGTEFEPIKIQQEGLNKWEQFPFSLQNLKYHKVLKATPYKYG